jgi:hypothetical protein
MGLPRYPHHPSGVPCPLPRRIGRVRLSIASPSVRPSPFCRRVGIHISTFEACSGFTRVTARRIAQPPKAAFVTRLRSGRLPDQTARQLPELSTIPWMDPSSTSDTRPRGALQNSRFMACLTLRLCPKQRLQLGVRCEDRPCIREMSVIACRRRSNPPIRVTVAEPCSARRIISAALECHSLQKKTKPSAIKAFGTLPAMIHCHYCGPSAAPNSISSAAMNRAMPDHLCRWRFVVISTFPSLPRKEGACCGFRRWCGGY